MPPTSTLEILPPISRLSPSIIRILGDNPSKFTLQGTNTYLLGTGSSRILLDTGEGKPAWKKHLADTLRQEKANISTVLLSHWHPDHVGGIRDVRDLVAELGGDRDQPTVWKREPRDGERDINDGQLFEADGVKLKAVHTPGHTTDHIVFLLEKDDAMFTADNVLGHGTAVFEDLSTYLSSLNKMKSLFRGKAYPGHGPVLEDGPKRISEYIAHRKEREDQVIRTMKSKDDGSYSWTVMEAVKIVYKDVPETLHLPAAGGVRQILLKLEAEGRVAKEPGHEERWRLKERSTL